VKHNKLKEHDLRVLAMMHNTHEKVARIATPVDYHKRYDRNDLRDPYGSVIEWVHETGAWLFGPYHEQPNS